MKLFSKFLIFVFILSALFSCDIREKLLPSDQEVAFSVSGETVDFKAGPLLEFGVVEPGASVVSHPVSFQNVKGERLKIASISSTSPYFSFSQNPEGPFQPLWEVGTAIDPGQELSFFVRYAPSKVGNHESRIIIRFEGIAVEDLLTFDVTGSARGSSMSVITTETRSITIQSGELVLVDLSNKKSESGYDFLIDIADSSIARVYTDSVNADRFLIAKAAGNTTLLISSNGIDIQSIDLTVVPLAIKDTTPVSFPMLSSYEYEFTLSEALPESLMIQIPRVADDCEVVYSLSLYNPGENNGTAIQSNVVGDVTLMPVNTVSTPGSYYRLYVEYRKGYPTDLEASYVSVSFLPVEPDAIQSISYAKSDAVCLSGQFLAVDPVITPASENAAVHMVSSDESVICLVDGKLLGVKPGTAVVSAVSLFNPSISGSIQVTVEASPLLPSTGEAWNEVESYGYPVWLKVNVPYIGASNYLRKDDTYEGSGRYYSRSQLSVYDGNLKVIHDRAQKMYTNPLNLSLATAHGYIKLSPSHSGKGKIALQYEVPVGVTSITGTSSVVTVDSGTIQNNPFTVEPASAVEKWVVTASDNTAVIDLDESGRVFARRPGTASVKCYSVADPSIFHTVNYVVNATTLVPGQWTDFSLSGEALAEKWYTFSNNHPDQNYYLFKNDQISGDGSKTGSFTLTVYDKLFAEFASGGKELYTSPAAIAGNSGHTEFYVKVASAALSSAVTTAAIKLQEPVAPSTITLPAAMTLSSGARSTVSVDVQPAGSLDYLVYKSSDTSVVSFQKGGTLYAMKPGTATLTVESTFDPAVSDSLQVTVSAVPLTPESWNTISHHGTTGYPVWCSLPVSQVGYNYQIYMNSGVSGDGSFSADASAKVYDTLMLNPLSMTGDLYKSPYEYKPAAGETMLYLACDITAAGASGEIALKVEAPVAPVSISFAPVSQQITSGQVLRNFLQVDPPEAIDYLKVDVSRPSCAKVLSPGEIAASEPGSVQITYTSVFDPAITATRHMQVAAVELAKDEWATVRFEAPASVPVWGVFDIVASEKLFKLYKDDSIEGSGTHTAGISIDIYEPGLLVNSQISSPGDSLYTSPASFSTVAGQTAILVKMDRQGFGEFGETAALKLISPVDPVSIAFTSPAAAVSGSLIKDYISVQPAGALDHVTISTSDALVADFDAVHGLVFSKPGTVKLTALSKYDPAVTAELDITVTARDISADLWHIVDWHGISGKNIWFRYENSTPDVPVLFKKDDANSGSGLYDARTSMTIWNSDLTLKSASQSSNYINAYQYPLPGTDVYGYIEVAGNSVAGKAALQIEYQKVPLSLNPVLANVVSNSGDLLSSLFTVEPASASENLIYSVGDTAVVKSTGHGEFAACKPGTTVVTVRSRFDSSITSNVTVFVQAVDLVAGNWNNCNYHGLKEIPVWYRFANDQPDIPYEIRKDDGIEGSGAYLPELDMKIYSADGSFISNPDDALYLKPAAVSRPVSDLFIMLSVESIDDFQHSSTFRLNPQTVTAPESVGFSVADTTLSSGRLLENFLTVTPADTADQVQINSSDSSVVKVVDGNRLLAGRPGTATITAVSKLDAGVTASLALTVSAVSIESGKWVEGISSGDSTQDVWYEVANTQKGALALLYSDDGYEGSGSYLPEMAYTLYRTDATTQIISGQRILFTEPARFTTPAADDKLFIRANVRNPLDGQYRHRMKLQLAVSTTSAEITIPATVVSGSRFDNAFVVEPAEAFEFVELETSYSNVFGIVDGKHVIACEPSSVELRLYSKIDRSIVARKTVEVSPRTVSTGDWQELTFPGNNGFPVWYTFESPAGEQYMIDLNDAVNGSGFYTQARMSCSLYVNNPRSTVVNNQSGFYGAPITFSNTTGNPMYLAVDGNGPARPVTFGVKISKVIYVTALTAVQSSMKLAVGASQSLPVQVTPGLALADVEYISSDDTVATVNSQGLVTAVGSGSAVITARSKSDNSIFEPVTVTTYLDNLLTAGVYAEGSLANGETVKYHFEAVAGSTYQIFWDDSWSGSGSYTCDIAVSCKNLGTSQYYFQNSDSAYHSPKVVNIAADSILQIVVRGYDSGTFALKIQKQ